jgi:L-fuconolactonase
MNIIDTHAHAFSTDTQTYPLSPEGGEQSGWSKDHPTSHEQFVEHMDKAGVAKTVLVQASTVYGFDNRYVVDSVKLFPDRFIGVGCIDPAAPGADETLRVLIEDNGMSGVRVRVPASIETVSDAERLDGDAVRPFWREVVRLNTPVAANVHRTCLPMLVNVLQEYPTVRILLDHLANPSLDDGAPYAQAQSLFDLAQHPNLYLKFSTESLRAATAGSSTVEAFFGKLVDAFGANRMMWGSNFPASWAVGDGEPYCELVDLPRNELAFLGEDALTWMMGETARSIYPEL